MVSGVLHGCQLFFSSAVGMCVCRFRTFHFHFKRAETFGCADFPAEQGVTGCCPAACHLAGRDTSLDCVCIDATTLKRSANSARVANRSGSRPGISSRIIPPDAAQGVDLFPAAGDAISRDSHAFRDRIEEVTKAAAKESPADNPCSQFEAAAGDTAGKGSKSRSWADQMMFGAFCRRVLPFLCLEKCFLMPRGKLMYGDPVSFHAVNLNSRTFY